MVMVVMPLNAMDCGTHKYYEDVWEFSGNYADFEKEQRDTDTYRYPQSVICRYERKKDEDGEYDNAIINVSELTNGMGEYSFSIKLTTYKWEWQGKKHQISEYILEFGRVDFKYNGVSYIQTVPVVNYGLNTSLDIFSNAAENEKSRKGFNKKFENVNLDNEIAANAYGKFSGGRSVLDIPINGVKNGNPAYQMKATTELEQIGDEVNGASGIIRVNLGLLTREIDVSLSTQVEKAEILINDKNTTYNYGDILEGKLTTVNLNKLVDANKGASIPIEIYSSDYYYRIEDYKTGTLNEKNKDVEGAKSEKTEDKELKVYVTYKVRLFAATAGKNVKINQIAYYHDQNYELVSIQGGTQASPLDSNLSQIDGMKGIMINGDWDVSSEEQYVYLKFEVTKYNDAMYTGNINGHVVAITSYSTTDGLLDIDSAVRNLRGSGANKDKITKIDQIEFEDDTGIAEKILIKLTSEERTISGNVFEDLNKDGNFANENGINDVIVQLIEITKNNNEYIWQETLAGTKNVSTLVANEENNHINGREFEGIRNYENSINGIGQYEFKDIVPGNYIVRFIYGDGYNYDITADNTKYNGTDYKSTKDAEYNTEWYNGTNYFGTGASVARDNEARRLEIMATTNQIDAGLGTALEIYAKNRTLASLNDVEKANIVSYIKSLANIDKQDVDPDNKLSQAMAKVFDNIKTYNDVKIKARNITEANLNEKDLEVLKKCIAYKTFMVAETSKINVPVDTSTLADTSDTTTINSTSGYIYNKVNIKYPNVNLGITLRPQIKLELEKHITALKITPSGTGVQHGTGVQPIIDARANIADIIKGNEVVATGETKGLLTIKSTRGERGQWYVQTDTQELEQGANLEVEYTYIIKNTGEEDYISSTLAELYQNNPEGYSEQLKKTGKELKDIYKGNTHNYGKILGTYYYTGNKGTDVLVTSRVELLGEAINNSLRYDKDTSGNSFKKANEEGTKVQKTIYDVEGEKKTEEIDTVVETTSPSKFLTPGKMDVSKTINLSKILASLNVNQEENIASYIAEVIKYSSASGARNLETVPGNLSYVHSKDTKITMETDNEKDEFWGETIKISNKTGGNKILAVQIGITVVVSIAVIGVGIVLIKKFVLTK